MDEKAEEYQMTSNGFSLFDIKDVPARLPNCFSIPCWWDYTFISYSINIGGHWNWITSSIYPHPLEASLTHSLFQVCMSLHDWDFPISLFFSFSVHEFQVASGELFTEFLLWFCQRFEKYLFEEVYVSLKRFLLAQNSTVFNRWNSYFKMKYTFAIHSSPFFFASRFKELLKAF